MKLPLALTLALLSSCLPNERPDPGALPLNLVLRSYEVPNEGAAQVRSVLKTLLWFGSDGKDSQKYIGRADIGPDGRLVVMATEGVQAGVKSLIDSLAKNPPKPAGSIQLSYWFVFALPGKGAAPAANLQELGSALEEIEKVDGPQQFTLAEKVTVTSLGGEEARLEGHNASVRQVATSTARGISADINLRLRSQKLDTRVSLTPGQIAVLGSSGAMGEGKDAPVGSVYFVIRAASHDGQGR